MYETQSPRVSLEKDAVTLLIPLHRPMRLVARLDRRSEQIAADSRPPDVSPMHQRHNVRLRGYAPTPAARTTVPALIARVDVEAESGHVRIISGEVRGAQR